MTEAMQRRAKAIRARAVVRRWEYRQRDRAHGVWFRLRLVLARAEAAWSVPEEVMAGLLAEGFSPEPVGLELEPSKTLVFVPRARVTTLAQREPLAMHLDGPMLAARWIVLVAY